ncbi:TPA: hypothetical protein HA338_16515 [Methanosarcina acetivorans]|uniref:Uncharacterized protein n=1 Tax=Methanosarcina acetivorans TaxID=2214 RepID=A0A832WA01_9EURY|nr:hypothetical protein [Methanosarcina acetivorans]HIH95538.1 hypothetical protein [Methanosarcina acetivorans]
MLELESRTDMHPDPGISYPALYIPHQTSRSTGLNCVLTSSLKLTGCLRKN